MKNIKKYIFTFIIVLFAINFGNTQGFRWDENWNSSSTYNDQGNAVTTDASGNVYVTGEAKKGTGNDSYIETIKYNSAGTQQWAMSCDDSYSGTDYALAIAVDGSGNVWVAGTRYTGTTYYYDLVLVKYNSSGTLQTNYPKVYNDLSGTDPIPRATCIAIYGSEVFVAGCTITSSGRKIIVLKDNPSGAGWSYTYTYPSSYVSEAEATDLKTNFHNGVLSLYVTGYCTNASEGLNTFTARLDPSDLTADWEQEYNNGGTRNDVSNALAVDSKNEYLYVAGYAVNTSNYRDALLIRYETDGTELYGVTWNGGTSNYSDFWTDIALNSDETKVFTGGTKGVSASARDYALAAYVASSGSLSGSWATNPRTYDGSGSDVTGTDYGYAIDYRTETDRVYITGKSYETSGGVNITSLGYDAADGSLDWGPYSYDYGSDALLGGPDEVAYKNELITRYNDYYCVDEVLITGESSVTHHGYDYITFKYGPADDAEPCAKKIMNPDIEQKTTLYPNPFSDEAVISIDDEQEISNASLYIYDIMGNLVKEQHSISDNIIVVTRGNLSTGVYYYKLTNDKQIFSGGKFLISD